MRSSQRGPYLPIVTLQLLRQARAVVRGGTAHMRVPPPGSRASPKPRSPSQALTGVEATRRQLDDLAARPERETIDVRVIPTSVGGFPGAAHALLYAACFRMGTDPQGNAYIAVAGQEERYVTDSREALRALNLEIKTGKADHLL